MPAESDCLKSNGSVVSGRMATGGGVVDGEGVVGASGQWMHSGTHHANKHTGTDADITKKKKQKTKTKHQQSNGTQQIYCILDT